MKINITYTVATLEVPKEVFLKVEELLVASGYGDRVKYGSIDMQGLSLVPPVVKE